ncbi:hypothetical protein GCK72_001224 [Caenorhabditis remanei]|uniref:Uncharacterized protein n=1 Tax=Caenorhabditis remanei TaxID=31234 RepID=A0A6A5HSU3_CAERE|nr:hypothetical protein GCK72_001224 [Caenorhabditis remanei]KAF1769407.1 hypothetical protein GCK72_001224 [Caenorhabditis remanei]
MDLITRLTTHFSNYDCVADAYVVDAYVVDVYVVDAYAVDVSAVEVVGASDLRLGYLHMDAMNEVQSLADCAMNEIQDLAGCAMEPNLRQSSSGKSIVLISQRQQIA